MTERIDFVDVLRELAKMFEADVGPFVLSVYERTLSRFGTDRLIRAAEKLVIEKRPGSRFPTVAEFLDALGESPVSEANKAVDIANRIWGTVVSCGYTCRPEVLLERCGEIGVYVAKMHGGWARFCDETDNLKDPSFFKAALVKEVAAYMEKSRKGVLELPPSFNDDKSLPLNQKVLEAIGVAVGQPSNDEKNPQKESTVSA